MGVKRATALSDVSPDTDWDLVIVGAGLVGCAAAAALAPVAQTKGWRLALLDACQPKDPAHPSFDTRATALSYGSVVWLEALGIWPHLKSQAAPIKSIEVSSAQQWGKTRMCASEQGVAALGWVVSNQAIGQAFQKSCLATSACTQLYGVAVERVVPCTLGYRLALADGRELRTRLLLIAEGYPSKLARQLGIGYRQKACEQYALVANLRWTQPHQSRAFERFTVNGPLALLPLQDARATAMVMIVSAQQFEQYINTVDEAQARAWAVQALACQWGSSLGLVEHMSRVRHYPLVNAVADEIIRPQLALLGNAAHLLHPVAGQGFNLALRELAALTQIMTETDWQDQKSVMLALFCYQQAIAWDKTRTTAFSHYLPQLFQSGWLPVQVLRSCFLTALNLMPGFKASFTHMMMGLSGSFDGPSQSLGRRFS